MMTDLMDNTSQPTLPAADPASGHLPLIITKIRLPRRRPGLLSRRRLVDFIHTHLDRKLILISAPAGYGKTSLLTDWAHETDLPVCWYTLDTFDCDLRVFLEHLIASIVVRFPAFGQRSRAFLQGLADPSHHLYPIVATLVQEIYDVIPEYFCLILDDLHAVEEQEKINEFLDLLVTYVDENCHFIFASRTLPALPNLSLLLARRQAAGLSIDELRFTPSEIQALALQNYGLQLAATEVHKLAERTEGWITGLLLTAAPGWEQIHQNIATQGHINLGLYDYLSKQVLDRQPAPLQDFLLVSSLLDEVSPDLCMAALNIERPTEWMDQVRARNLFLVEFEGAADRLRYHQLFREFLQTSLRRQDEVRFRELTRRVADAYGDRGQWEQAVSRYLALRDYDRVAGIIDQRVTEMYETGRWDTLANWIDALPDAALVGQPRLLVYRARIHADRGEHVPALNLYERAERAFLSLGDRSWGAYALAQKSCVLRFQGRYVEAVERCQEALAMAGGDTPRDKITLALAQRNMGLCRVGLGQLADGMEALRQALCLYQDLGDAYDIGMVHHDLGMSHDLAGELGPAVDHYQAALQNWRQLGSPGPWAHTLNNLSVIYHVRGEYDQASLLLNEALSKIRQAGNLRVEAAIWASLGDLHRDKGAYERAKQAYGMGLEVATRAGEGFVATYTLDALGNISRLGGNLALAHKHLSDALDSAREHASAYEVALCHTSLGILATEERNLALAQDYLNQAIACFEGGGYKRELARAYLHRAQSRFLAGEEQMALADLEQTLSLAAQLGFDQFIVVDGLRLQPLLRFAFDRGIGNSQLSHLLESIQVYQTRLAQQPEPIIHAEPLPALRIYALGSPRIELGGKTVQWASTQSRDLFFCLLEHPEGLRKEQVGIIFWPDHAPEKLEAIFRSTVYRLRRALFRESVSFEDGLYRVNRQMDYEYDVETFDRLLDQAGQSQAVAQDKMMALLEKALELYRGDYVEGIYSDWCELERERLRARFMAAVQQLAGLYAERGKLQRAIEFYQLALAHDPYQEVAYRGLMHCYYRLGDRSAAIQQYQACAKILQAELGLRPMPETEELYQQILH